MPELTRPPLLEALQRTLHGRGADAVESDVVLSYTGSLDGATSDALLMLAERGVWSAGGSRKEVRRIANVLIECLENVVRHGWVDDRGETHLFLTLERTPLGYQIQAGNLVDLEMAAELRSRLVEVNGMSHEELRRRYVEVLCDGSITARGGAGLGLLSMAKKAQGPLDYQFDERAGGLFLFTLAVMVKS